jgi:hypothetical protein
VILADTSIWVDHLRSGAAGLNERLLAAEVLGHPFIIGELACGHLRGRSEILALLQDLPQARVGTDAEVLYYIERYRLMGRGIGYVDAHLLAATALTPAARLWTADRKLHEVAVGLGLARES